MTAQELQEALARQEPWLLQQPAVKAIIPRLVDPVELTIVVKDSDPSLVREIKQRFAGVPLKVETGDTTLHT